MAGSNPAGGIGVSHQGYLELTADHLDTGCATRIMVFLAGQAAAQADRAVEVQPIEENLSAAADAPQTVAAFPDRQNHTHNQILCRNTLSWSACASPQKARRQLWIC
ncbi:MAG: hypothetical protein ABI129_03260 [Rhodanobacter sp.]